MSFDVMKSILRLVTIALMLFAMAGCGGSENKGEQSVDKLLGETNAPPQAYEQNLTIVKDANISITLKGSDPEHDPLSFVVTSQPSNGVLSGTAPELVYIPNPGYSGVDTFTFKVNDGTSSSRVVIVQIVIVSRTTGSNSSSSNSADVSSSSSSLSSSSQSSTSNISTSSSSSSTQQSSSVSSSSSSSSILSSSSAVQVRSPLQAVAPLQARLMLAQVVAL